MGKLRIILIALLSIAGVAFSGKQAVYAGTCDSMRHDIQPDPLRTDQGQISITIIVYAASGCFIVHDDYPYVYLIKFSKDNTFRSHSAHPADSEIQFSSTLNFNTDEYYGTSTIPFKLCLVKKGRLPGLDDPFVCLQDSNYLFYESSFTIIREEEELKLQVERDPPLYRVREKPKFRIYNAKQNEELVFWWHGNVDTHLGGYLRANKGFNEFKPNKTQDAPETIKFCMATKRSCNVCTGNICATASCHNCTDPNLYQELRFTTSPVNPTIAPTFSPPIPTPTPDPQCQTDIIGGTPVPTVCARPECATHPDCLALITPTPPGIKAKDICEQIKGRCDTIPCDYFSGDEQKECLKKKLGCDVHTGATQDKCTEKQNKCNQDVQMCLDCFAKRGAWTALGCIKTDVGPFVRDVFRIILGVVGGIAFLLLLGGGFKIMVSRGDAEQLAEGQQTITAAVFGLIFVFLAVFILKIIGVDILGLPGFGPD